MPKLGKWFTEEQMESAADTIASGFSKVQDVAGDVLGSLSGQEPSSVVINSEGEDENRYSHYTSFPKSDQDPKWGTFKGDKSPEIIGLPPHAYLDIAEGGTSPSGVLKKLSLAAMPIVEIQPCLPQFGSGADGGAGLQLFSLDPGRGMEQWKKIVSHCGFENDISGIRGPLQIAFLNETSIGEQWSSSFEETQFEGLVNKGSSMAQTMRMLTGTKNLSDAVSQMSNNIGGAGKDIGLEIGNLLRSGESGIDRLFGEAGKAGRSLASGSRVDFPQVWQGSNFEPSYNLTIRLYNPWPNEPAAYKRFILLPLCMILAMCVPISDSKWTYNFPLFCKARCPGLFNLPAAAFSSVRVVKGGDSNDVSWHQQPGTIDVQLTLDSLFQTMIATTGDSNEVDKHDERPTLKKYFDSLRDWIDYKTPYGDTSVQGTNRDAGGIKFDPNQLSTNPQTASITDDIVDRVPSSAIDINDILTASFDADEAETLSTQASLMSTMTDQLDDISNSVSRGFGDMYTKLSDSLGNFDISGLGILGDDGTIPEFSVAQFSGALDLENTLGGEYGSASSLIGGPGFPGGISAIA